MTVPGKYRISSHRDSAVGDGATFHLDARQHTVPDQASSQAGAISWLYIPESPVKREQLASPGGGVGQGAELAGPRLVSQRRRRMLLLYNALR